MQGYLAKTAVKYSAVKKPPERISGGFLIQ